MGVEGSDLIALRVKCQKATNIRMETHINATLTDFTARLEELTGIPADSMTLLKGFPPKRISYYRNTGTVNDLGLQAQDTLIVELGKPGDNVDSLAGQQPSGVSGPQQDPVHCSQRTTPANSLASSESAVVRDLEREPPANVQSSNSGNTSAALSHSLNQSDTSASPTLPTNSVPSDTFTNGLLMRHVVPADNSCLFASVAFCLSDVEQIESTVYLREVIAATVASDPEKYNEAFLGRSNADYCKWIKMSDSWGGGIEVSILSKFYGYEITVVNIQSASVSRFGEDQNYSHCILLLYDGIHYDPLYMEIFDIPAQQKLFSSNDMRIMQQALQLAEEAKRAHQFTDIKNFQLKCNRCNIFLKGNTEAQQHAKSTGHVDFSET